MDRKPWTCCECNITMIMSKEKDSCKCPRCGVEVWFEHNTPLPPISTPGHTYISRSLQPGYQIPPGGSKSSRKRSKPDPMKALRTEQYKLA